jgi:hypothetical protein
MCTPAYLVPNVLHEFAVKLHKTLEQRDQPMLVDYMINAGIRCHFVHTLAPELAPEQVMGYTPEQWKWVQKNEAEVYTQLLPLLFERNALKFDRYINMAPFTATFGQEAPARLAEYIGWQIVQQYLSRNPTDLPSLVRSRNYSQIFQQAAYKP